MPKFNTFNSAPQQQETPVNGSYYANTEYLAFDNGYEQQEKQQSKVSKKLGEIGMKLAGMKPVWVPEMSGMNVMTANTYEQYSAFENTVQQSRYANKDFDYHSPATKKEFKNWKKTGLLPGERAQQVTNQILGYEPLQDSYHVPENNEPYYMSNPFQAPPESVVPTYNTNPFVPPANHQVYQHDNIGQMQSSQYIDSFYHSTPSAINMENSAYAYEPSTASIVLNRSQEEIWSTYEANVKAEAAPTDAELGSNEIRSRMEVNHVVKRAPRFSDQIRDIDRINEVTYVADRSFSLGTSTSDEMYKPYRETVSEHTGLLSLHDFLQRAASNDRLSENKQNQARSMIDNMTFIGEKEHREAAAGIAESWKGELDKNPELQIYAVAGEIAKSGTAGSSGDMIKSDEYLLDKILANFSDEEVKKYTGRLVTDAESVTAKNADNLRIVLLDDWTISGKQVKDATGYFLKKNPEFKKSLEVQLVASNEDRIKNGIRVFDNTGIQTNKIPVKSYYLANVASKPEAQHGAHITGFHSSVDFDFEYDIQHMLDATKDKTGMPPLTNIVRPYRMEGVELTNKDRFATPESASRSSTEKSANPEPEPYYETIPPVAIKGYENFPF